MLTKAYQAWTDLEPLRAIRRRNKRYAYGFPDRPNHNNLIRQLIKSIIGRYRFLQQPEPLDLGTPHSINSSEAMERDCRALEEFLISGLAIQGLDYTDRYNPVPVNISPDAFFFTRFHRPDASDCMLLGVLHDMDPARVITAFGAHMTATDIQEIIAQSRMDCYTPPCGEAPTDFYRSSLPGHVRIIEVWQRTRWMGSHVHDADNGELHYTTVAPDPRAIEALNAKRRSEGRRPVAVFPVADSVWRHTWLTPKGLVLAQEWVPLNDLPLVVRAYPCLDGEVHSLVSDLVGQQEYINRLVATLDDVIAQSAKGVLLFPTDQLPNGFTWKDMRRIWADPGGVIPYRRTAKGTEPKQIQTAGWHSGAAEMLKLQLELFDQMSGMSAAMRGAANGYAGAEVAKRDMENSTMALLDVLGAFARFIEQRDAHFLAN